MGCGICGFFGLSDRELLRKMCEVLRHRGPDDTGFFIDKNIGLGIDRLKIIDLVSGDQPIHNEDGSIWIVFNGEIYNYGELVTELQSKGHRFYTASDTESIVHSYEEWGETCVAHLRGMFAFAIWDSKKNRLYLARDRFGKKPLYYARIGSTLIFASELKSILQCSGVPRELDYDAIDFYFTYAYIPSPLSVFKTVRKLPPGCYASFDGQSLSITQYWDYAPHPDSSLNEDVIAERLFRSMEDAVRIRLRSDVPLGAFLSGGIDSSTVVSLMSRLSLQPVKTVAIGFDDDDGGLSELAYSRKIAEFLGTDHHEYTVTADAVKILPKLVWHFDEPFADPAIIPQYYLSEVTRREVTVALSGDGGDELLMGYPFLVDPPRYTLYSRVPSYVRRPALRALLSLPGNRQFKRDAKHAYDKSYGKQSYGERYVMRVSLHDEAGLRKLYAQKHLAKHALADTYGHLLGLANSCSGCNDIDAADYATIRSYLEEDILVKVDRMSMAVSLEVRCPLLDQELVDLVQTIPAHLKMNGTETKYILKKMVISKGLVPKEIAMRKKQGFGAPIMNWMQKKEWKEIVSSVLDPMMNDNGENGLFDRDYLKSLMADPYLNSNKLFALITFGIWHKIYVEEDRVAKTADDVPVLI